MDTPLRDPPGSKFLPSHFVTAILCFDVPLSPQSVLIFQWDNAFMFLFDLLSPLFQLLRL